MIDSPIELASIDKLSIDEIDKLLEGIRERRLRPIRDFEEAQGLKDLATREGMIKQYNNHIKMFKKEQERVDKALEKLEDRATKLRILKMELDA